MHAQDQVLTVAAAMFDPPLEDWPDAGVYQLWIRVRRDISLTVGRLGHFVFPTGVHVYTGRASRGLIARVTRHTGRTERKHWHIDYLLAHPQANLERVTLSSSDPGAECVVNKAGGAVGTCVARGFGASDCRERCQAHLWLVDGNAASSRIELSLRRGRNRGQKKRPR